MILLTSLLFGLSLFPRLHHADAVLPPESTRILHNPFTGLQLHSSSQDQWTRFPDVKMWYYRGSGSIHLLDMTRLTWEDNRWDVLNPEEDEFDFSGVRTYLTALNDRSFYGAMRMRNKIRPTDPPPVPDWAVPVTPLRATEDNANEIQYFRCEFLSFWEKVVEQLRLELANHPEVLILDIGSIGPYGEAFDEIFGRDWSAYYDNEFVGDGTMSPYWISIDTLTRMTRMFTGGSGYSFCVNNNPSDESDPIVPNFSSLTSDDSELTRVWYDYAGFPDQFIVMNQGAPMRLRIGLENGAGWRFDGFGNYDEPHDKYSWVVFWEWLNSVGLRNPDTRRRWHVTPNTVEFSRGADVGLDANNLARTYCHLRGFHIGSVHVNHDGSSDLDGSDFDDVFREMGFRIVIAAVGFASSVQSGNTLSVQLTMKNIGSAPVYKKYPLYVYFSLAGETVFCQKIDSVDIRQILPADVSSVTADFLTCSLGAVIEHDFDFQISVPSGLSNGDYDVSVAFRDDIYDVPLDLAHDARDSEGRFELGSVTISGGDGSFVSSCNDDVSWIPLDDAMAARPAIQPRAEVLVPHLVFAESDGWVDDGDSFSADEDLHIRANLDSQEAMIAFDATSGSIWEDVHAMELLLAPWQTVTPARVATVEVSYVRDTTWISAGPHPLWDERPCDGAGVTALGTFEMPKHQHVLFKIPQDKLSELAGHQFTICLKVSESVNVLFASYRFKNGYYRPLMRVYTSPQLSDTTSLPPETIMMIVGAVVGSFVGLLLLLGLIVGIVVCVVVCKKKKSAVFDRELKTRH